MVHGTQDPVVQFAWAEASRRLLAEVGWNVEWHTYPMAHAAVMEEVVACGKFLATVLGLD
jgi:phospholipase/carboxylesterase